MPNIKQIILNYSSSGLTTYCLVYRESDGYLLDDATGAFAAAPVDYFVPMVESGIISGRYQRDENRSAWVNGLYTVAIYKQVSVDPDPHADMMIGDGTISIENDMEITGSLSSLPWGGTTTVEAILDNVLPRLKAAQVDIYSAVNSITDLIYKRLWRMKSDLVTSELTLVLAPGNNTVSLPAYFSAIKSSPYLAHNGEGLDPLPEGMRARATSRVGDPAYFELIQGTLYLFPAPRVPTTIKCFYIRNPGKVALLSDIVPFASMFDNIYTEGIVKYAAQGINMTLDAAFAAFLDEGINLVTASRSMSLPSRRPAKFF